MHSVRTLIHLHNIYIAITLPSLLTHKNLIQIYLPCQQYLVSTDHVSTLIDETLRDTTGGNNSKFVFDNKL